MKLESILKFSLSKQFAILNLLNIVADISIYITKIKTHTKKNLILFFNLFSCG